jgi:hypothetical protein
MKLTEITSLTAMLFGRGREYACLDAYSLISQVRADASAALVMRAAVGTKRSPAH